jgi:hypothetical protein
MTCSAPSCIQNQAKTLLATLHTSKLSYHNHKVGRAGFNKGRIRVSIRKSRPTSNIVEQHLPTLFYNVGPKADFHPIIILSTTPSNMGC